MLSRYQFTTAQRQRGGWQRARQHALRRAEQPSPAEQRAREMVRALLPQGALMQVEAEIFSGEFPQWLDILVTLPDGRRLALEVDGSHDWHGEYESSKMYRYDLAKRRWCEQNGVTLVVVRADDFSLAPDGARSILVKFFGGSCD